MHIPVLKTEILEALHVSADKMYLDGTFGRGGHTGAILEQGGKVIAFDMDQEAIAFGKEKFAQEIASGQLVLVENNFSQLTAELKRLGFAPHSFAGALFDLGMSSDQVDDSGRGFTFQKDEPLDMRMSTSLGVTAADLLNALPEKHLKTLFWENSQETFSSAIARAVVERRGRQPWAKTRELADLISRIKRGRQDSKIHPATKVFQALRIAVNTELDNLTLVLDQVLPWLSPEAVLCVISFHEGEDKQVKQAFKLWEKLGKGIQMTQKPITPGEQELSANRRSRSAKLRTLRII